MVQAVRMPMLGNTMETGLLVEWVVTEGDEVVDGDVLAVVESEKASAEVTASQDGVLARVDVDEDEEIPPGTVMGVILGSDEDLANAPEPRSHTGVQETTENEATAGSVDSENEDANGTVAAKDVDDSSMADEDIEAAPGARKLAVEHDVNLGTIDGTGPEGAVLRIDVEEYLETAASESERKVTEQSLELDSNVRFVRPSTRRLAREQGISLADTKGTGTDGRVTESDVRAAAGMIERPGIDREDHDRKMPSSISETEKSDTDVLGVTVTGEQPLTGIRRTIASRMSQSIREAPHVTLKRDVAVDRALETVDDLASARDTPIKFTDLLVAAVVRSLAAHPRFNAWFEEDSLRLIEETNIAVAVDTGEGLIAPVISDADSLSLNEIARERCRLTAAAVNGKYTVDDLQGGTFTISNLGMFDVDSFDPIINPPQVSILGVGHIKERGDGQMCTLSLSFDHRVVDGADAARFLDVLAEGIESPTIVVADRVSVGSVDRSGVDSETDDQGRDHRDEGQAQLEEAIRRDLTERAQNIAAAHDWPTPTFVVELDGKRPTVTVGAQDSASHATMKRLTYATCRESVFADTIVGFRDPVVTVR